ncbi:MAG: indolepyruvate oxidoreductase subunit beta [Acidobacteriota bacterium]|nr:MAG: indolepyruvate oxidoreductase subunit beta [Acidobacteriota bacterium]
MSGRQRILLVGVGGQGVLSAGRWLGDAADAQGLEMTVAQIHGLSQRGGSVQSAVGLGGLRSPEIPSGMADVLLAFEPMEALRALPKISKRTAALVNTRPLLPSSLQSTGRPYPALSSLLDPLRDAAGSLLALDATSLADRAGSFRSLNAVMLGLLAGSGLLSFPAERLLDAMLEAVHPPFREVNRKAFSLGQHAIHEVRAS